MRYLGGKARIGKRIAEQILRVVPPEHRCEYLEPFLGGANAFEHIAPHFEKTYVGDVHEDLILVWQAAARGWEPPHVDEARAVTIARCSFLDWPVVPGVVLYCDPPYLGTTGYITGPFDHDVFWARMREWAAAGSYVFVSEESAPSDWDVLWVKEKTLNTGLGNVKRARVEKLFYRLPANLAKAA